MNVFWRSLLAWFSVLILLFATLNVVWRPAGGAASIRGFPLHYAGRGNSTHFDSEKLVINILIGHVGSFALALAMVLCHKSKN